MVHFGESWVVTRILDLSFFTGAADGPLVLEGPDSTIVVPAGMRVKAGAHGIIRASVAREGDDAGQPD